jgi:polar amino acid transport system substrate-binding protein
MNAIAQWWDTNPITHIFFSPEVMRDSLPLVRRGFPITLALGILSFLFTIPFALVLAFMKMSDFRILRFRPLNAIATTYIDIVRGTPMILYVLIIYMSLPLIPAYKALLEPFRGVEFLGLSVSSWLRSFIILSSNSAAYMAEIFRAGIQSIPKGQMEAARSLGMTRMRSMVFVILPQTIRRILPTSMSEFILILKDTALLSTVSIGEVMLQAKNISAKRMNTTPLVLATLFYLVITIPLGRLVAFYENKLAEQDDGQQVKGKRPPRLDIESNYVVPHKENVMESVP